MPVRFLRNTTKPRGAFTLVDMLITIGVLVTLVTLLGPLFINFSRTARDSRVKQELLFEASPIAKYFLHQGSSNRRVSFLSHTSQVQLQ